MSADKIIQLVDILNDDQLAMLTPHLIGQWPNTYAFTKAIGEDTVRQYSKGIPTCIVRPSIMISTSLEPIRGWINNLYGPTGSVMGVAYGVLRTLRSKEECVADLIPADIVINNIIAAAWETIEKRKDQLNVIDANENNSKNSEEVAIYNTVSSVQNEMTWGRFMRETVKRGLEVPSEKAFWYYMFVFNRYKLMYNICVVFLHLLPAVIIDTIIYFMGKKPIMWKTYKKIHKYSNVIAYFSTQQWRFKNDRVMNLWNRLSPVDKRLFYFNMEDHDWDEYISYYMRGCRVYIANDPLETVERGQKRYKRLKIAHFTMLTVLGLLVLWGLYSLFNYLYALFSS